MGGGGSSSNGGSEAPNTLLSKNALKISDLLCEGPIKGFVQKSGSYGNGPLVSTYYDNVPVRNLNGSYNFNVSGQGYKFYYTLGTEDQSAVPYFSNSENYITLGANTQISNPPAGAGYEKVVTASFNSTMYPDANSIKIMMRVPALYAVDDEGNTDGYQMTYSVEVSLNNGPFVLMGNYSINGKCTSPYYEQVSFPLPKTSPAADYYQWTVRIKRTSEDILSVRVQNSLFVDGISVMSSNAFSYPNSVLVHTYITADQFASIPTRAYEIEGLLVSVPSGYTPTKYNTDGTITTASYPEIWRGNWQTGVYTNNPAWVFNDILSNKRYGLGNYIQKESIDKWSLYQISQYCDEMVDNGRGDGKTEPRFACNVYLGQQDDAYNVLLNFASVFRGMVYYANGMITATQTSDKTPVYPYNNSNVIGGQFTYADTARNTRSTVALVKWIDPDNLYRENVEYIEDTEAITRYGYIQKDVTAFACTSKGQAYRVGKWVLQNERLLTETCSFKVGLDGLYVKPGDVFEIYDNFRTNRDQGGRIISFASGGSLIELDRPVQIEFGNKYSLSALIPTDTTDNTGMITGSDQIVNFRAPQIEFREVSNIPTSGTRFLTVTNPFSTGLFAGSAWILSASGDSAPTSRRSSLYQCVSISESEPGIMDVVGLQYNTGINLSSETNYNINPNPINSGNFTPIEPPSNLTVVPVTGLLNTNQFVFFMALDWEPTPSYNIAYYNVSGKEFGGDWQFITNTTSDFASHPTLVTGLVEYRVAAVSNGGMYSDYISGSYLISGMNPFGRPASPTGLTISSGIDPSYIRSDGVVTGFIGKEPSFSWSYPKELNGNYIPGYDFVTGYKFSLETTGGAILNSGVSLGGFDNNSYQIDFDDLQCNRMFKAKVCAVDMWGNLSDPAVLTVNNPVPHIYTSGIFDSTANGGLVYSLTPDPRDIDISEVFLWVQKTGTSTGVFTPTYCNYTARSSNLAGVVNLDGAGGIYSVWAALSDSFSSNECLACKKPGEDNTPLIPQSPVEVPITDDSPPPGNFGDLFGGEYGDGEDLIIVPDINLLWSYAEVTPALIGITEFLPSSIPKKFRKRTHSGQIVTITFSSSSCSGENLFNTEIHSGNISFDKLTGACSGQLYRKFTSVYSGGGTAINEYYFSCSDDEIYYAELPIIFPAFFNQNTSTQKITLTEVFPHVGVPCYQVLDVSAKASLEDEDTEQDAHDRAWNSSSWSLWSSSSATALYQARTTGFSWTERLVKFKGAETAIGTPDWTYKITIKTQIRLYGSTGDWSEGPPFELYVTANSSGQITIPETGLTCPRGYERAAYSYEIEASY